MGRAKRDVVLVVCNRKNYKMYTAEAFFRLFSSLFSFSGFKQDYFLPIPLLNVCVCSRGRVMVAAVVV